MFRSSSSKHKALIAAEKVFRSLDTPKPLKYGVIATLAGAEGWAHEGKQSAQQVMYEALKQAIENGDETFTFHGRGYFSLTEHAIHATQLPEYAAVKRLGRKKRQEFIQVFYDVEEWKSEVCGRCQSIKFNGIKEINMEGGICLHNDSGRCGVNYKTAACPFWTQRSDSQMKQDYERAATLKIALLEIDINRKGLNPRKRAGKVK